MAYGGAMSSHSAVKNADLIIGVNNDLTPFNIDLKALTRGLVVIGQSGCGKSYLIGRLVEEIIRNTKDKSQLLIIDPNSDFGYGLELKTKKSFTNLVSKYKTGLLKKEYKSFKAKEELLMSEMKIMKEFQKTRVFGKSIPFNLSWKWLFENINNYLKIIKANDFSNDYFWALHFLARSFIGKNPYDPNEWFSAAQELIDLKDGKEVKLKYITDKYVDNIRAHVENKSILEIIYDLRVEAETSMIWNTDQAEKTIQERLFNSHRIEILDIESVIKRKEKLMLVIYVLENCLLRNKKLVEDYINLKDSREPQKRIKAKRRLRHTFILIDEAHNLAPDDTNDPHEKVLGELIHTIAAEGRKYGLHLILATQRPNKVKRGLLGECDNAIIMKMNSRSDLEHLSQEMRILDVKLLEPCLHFQGRGNAQIGRAHV